jgi:hypothetical protein
MRRDETPTGMPPDAEEEPPPLGVTEPGDDDGDGDGAEQMPGIPTEGEPPSAG